MKITHFNLCECVELIEHQSDAMYPLKLVRLDISVLNVEVIWIVRNYTNLPK